MSLRTQLLAAESSGQAEAKLLAEFVNENLEQDNSLIIASMDEVIDWAKAIRKAAVWDAETQRRNPK